MRQLGTAVDNYHSVHRRYPPGRFLGPFGAGPDSHAWSWLAMILPYLETEDLYSQGRIPQTTLSKSGVADLHVPIFICPSAPGNLESPRTDAGHLIGFPVGQTTYKGVSGANWGADKSLKRESVGTWRNEGTNGSFDGLSEGDGILWRSDHQRRMRQALVKDGLTKTFLVGEDLPKYNIWCSWPYPNNAYGECVIPPNIIPGNISWQYDSYSFRSAHPGGLNFAYAGGGVQFVSDDIDLDVYRALATRSGGEQVGEFQSHWSLVIGHWLVLAILVCVPARVLFATVAILRPVHPTASRGQ